MQKILCYIALAVAALVFLLFGADLLFGMLGMVNLAPFRYTNLLIDAVFAACGLAIGIMSWFTLREQV
jgi:hypothetical protein